MRSARREQFVSAAQVAFYFGGYTLEEAMKLSQSERGLLLAVAATEQAQMVDRLETTFGLAWDIEDLVRAPDSKGKKKKAETLPRKVRIPALLALAPEVFQALVKEYRSLYSAATRHGDNVPKGNTLVEAGTLSAEQAYAFWKQIAPQLGQSPSETQEK